MNFKANKTKQIFNWIISFVLLIIIAFSVYRIVYTYSYKEEFKFFNIFNGFKPSFNKKSFRFIPGGSNALKYGLSNPWR